MHGSFSSLSTSLMGSAALEARVKSSSEAQEKVLTLMKMHLQERPPVQIEEGRRRGRRWGGGGGGGGEEEEEEEGEEEEEEEGRNAYQCVLEPTMKQCSTGIPTNANLLFNDSTEHLS